MRVLCNSTVGTSGYPLAGFSDQGMNLTNIMTMFNGFDNKASPVAGGTGLVFIDDIRL